MISISILSGVLLIYLLPNKKTANQSVFILQSEVGEVESLKRVRSSNRMRDLVGSDLVGWRGKKVEGCLLQRGNSSHIPF